MSKRSAKNKKKKNHHRQANKPSDCHCGCILQSTKNIIYETYKMTIKILLLWQKRKITKRKIVVVK